MSIHFVSKSIHKIICFLKKGFTNGLIFIDMIKSIDEIYCFGEIVVLIFMDVIIKVFDESII